MNAGASTYAARAAAAPSPLVLTNAELLREADELALRIARSTLPVRDVRVVQALAARLKGAA